ncbi:MAG: DUF4160 domain-containing protein [Pseudomonadota bacterium]
MMRGGAEAKLWLEPELQFEYTVGFAPRDLRRILILAAAYADEIKDKWHDHFGS